MQTFEIQKWILLEYILKFTLFSKCPALFLDVNGRHLIGWSVSPLFPPAVPLHHQHSCRSRSHRWLYRNLSPIFRSPCQSPTRRYKRHLHHLIERFEFKSWWREWCFDVICSSRAQVQVDQSNGHSPMERQIKMVKISLFLSLFFRKGWHDQVCFVAMFHICLCVLFRFKGLKPTAALLSRGISDAESGRRTGQGWQGKKRLRSVVWARTKPPPTEWVHLYVSTNNNLCSELSGLGNWEIPGLYDLSLCVCRVNRYTVYLLRQQLSVLGAS